MTNWIEELESCLGDERKFNAAMARLQAAELDTPTLKALAREFRGAPARSRIDAYRKIEARQNALLDGQARLRAAGGRSAA